MFVHSTADPLMIGRCCGFTHTCLTLSVSHTLCASLYVSRLLSAQMSPTMRLSVYYLWGCYGDRNGDGRSQLLDSW